MCPTCFSNSRILPCGVETSRYLPVIFLRCCSADTSSGICSKTSLQTTRSHLSSKDESVTSNTRNCPPGILFCASSMAAEEMSIPYGLILGKSDCNSCKKEPCPQPTSSTDLKSNGRIIFLMMRRTWQEKGPYFFMSSHLNSHP